MQEALSQHGLQPLPVRAGQPFTGAGGIGGPAQVVAMLEVPVGVAQVNGVIRFTVLRDGESETPPLLSVKYMESVGAVIDFANEKFRKLGPEVSMRRLPTGHRAIPILDFDPDGWDLPVELRKDPDIDPFLLPSQSYVQAQDNPVLVWLVRDGKMEYVQDLPGPRQALVHPTECLQLPQLPLQPPRITHFAIIDNHYDPMILLDRWDLPTASASRAPWHGSVVFHALEGTEILGWQWF